MSYTMLLVDADETTTAFLADQLTADGYRTAIAHTTDAAYSVFASAAPDVVVLGDLGQRPAALALLDDIRAGARPVDPDVPVVVLSQHDTRLDVLRAFDHGADDVVAKPASYPELRARMRALLGRRRSRLGEVMRVRDLEIDTRTHRVLLGATRVALTPLEFALLVYLAADPERVFTKGKLMERVFGYAAGCSSRTLDSHACRLRRKLAIGDESWVVTVRGVGYALIDARDRDQGHAA